MESDAPSSSSAIPLPPPSSVANSYSSAAHPSPPNLLADSPANNKWATDLGEEKIDLPYQFESLYDADSIEKFKKYEADYTRRLMAKYFSRKNLYAGEIFDEHTQIEDEIIKSSRWPCTRSFADPVLAFEDQMSCSSTPVLEPTTTTSPNGIQQHNKSG